MTRRVLRAALAVRVPTNREAESSSRSLRHDPAGAVRRLVALVK